VTANIFSPGKTKPSNSRHRKRKHARIFRGANGLRLCTYVFKTPKNIRISIAATAEEDAEACD
jgi:hypothetical protein